MSKTRTWIAGAIAAVLVIVIGGYLVGISPIMSQISAASAQKTTIDQSNAVSQSKLASLKVQFASIGKLKKKLTTLRGSIPEQDGASSFLDELTALSSAYGVTLTSLSLASATIYADPNAPAAATPAPATDGSTAAPTTTTTTTTASGLIVIPVNLSVSGSFDAVKDFIGAAQKGTRLFFVSSTSIGGSGATATASVTGDVFSLQGTSDPAKKPASTSTSTATPTPTPTATATLTPTPNPTATTTTSGSTKSGGTSNPAPTTPPVQPTTPPTSDPTTDPDSTS